MTPEPVLQVYVSDNLRIGIALFANYSIVSVEGSGDGDAPDRPPEKLHHTVSTICLSDRGELRYDFVKALIENAIKAYYQMVNGLPF